MTNQRIIFTSIFLLGVVLFLFFSSSSCEEGIQPNVLLITIDTVRADQLGCYGGNLHTPNIDSLAKEGVLFESAFTPLPVTPPAHASILTGLYPMHHGLRFMEQALPPQSTTLAEILAGSGYTCSAVVASSVLDRRYGLNQGFDEYIQPVEAEAPADAQVRRMQDVVGKSKNPFFMWLHLYDAHLDYRPPPEEQTEFLSDPRVKLYGGQASEFSRKILGPAEEGVLPAEEDLLLARDLYGGEIRFMDKQLGLLFSYLKEHGLWDSTVIIVVADHGESFRREYPFDHGDRLYEEIVRVPLIIKYPHGPSGARIADKTDLTDIAPTILDILKIKPEVAFDGVSLIPSVAGGTAQKKSVYAEAPRRPDPLADGSWVSVIEGEYQFLRNLETDVDVFYPIVNGRIEEKNICAQQPSECTRYKDLLRRFLMTSFKEPNPVALPPDPDLRQKLEALGYLN